MTLESTISERLASLKDSIAVHASNRDVTIIAVSKYTDLEHIKAAYTAGFYHFGESRLQDVIAKQNSFSPGGLNWHFIGTLQSNKLGKSVGRFSLIHSVDSLAHAIRLSEVNAQQEKRQACLLQINPGEDITRNGFTPREVINKIENLLEFPGLSIEGLMAMAPPEQSINQDKLALEKTFEAVRFLRDDLANRSGNPLSTLSMGMSQDYEFALRQGSTMIRIGQAIFDTKN
jgi:PLP dependent protein